VQAPRSRVAMVWRRSGARWGCLGDDSGSGPNPAGGFPGRWPFRRGFNRQPPRPNGYRRRRGIGSPCRGSRGRAHGRTRDGSRRNHHAALVSQESHDSLARLFRGTDTAETGDSSIPRHCPPYPEPGRLAAGCTRRLALLLALFCLRSSACALLLALFCLRSSACALLLALELSVIAQVEAGVVGTVP